MNASVDMPVNKLSALKDLRARFPELNNDSIRFDGIAVGTAEGLNKKAGLADEFFKNIGKSMAGPVTSAADNFITSVMGEKQGLSDASKKGLRDAIRKKGSFLNPGTEGDIFEAAIRLVTTDAAKLDQAFDGNKNFQSPFDFEEGIGAGATQKLKDVFFDGSTKVYKADAKKTASRDTLQTLIKKTYNQAVADKSLKAGLPGLSTTMVAGEGHGGKLDADERKAAAARVGTAAKAKRDAKALGFVPNFMSLVRGGSKRNPMGYAGQVKGYQKDYYQGLESFTDLEGLLQSQAAGGNRGGFMSTTFNTKAGRGLARSFAQGTNQSPQRGGSVSKEYGRVNQGSVGGFNVRNVVNRKKLDRWKRMYLSRNPTHTPAQAEKYIVQKIFQLGGLGAAGQTDMFMKRTFSGGSRRVQSGHDTKRYGKGIGFDLTNWGGSQGNLQGSFADERAAGEVSVFAGTRHARGLHDRKELGFASGFVPNFVKYQIGQKLPKGRGAGGRHLAVRDQNMGVHWDPKAMFHADLVKRSGLQGKTMDGGWLFPNGRYEKIPGHDGSGLQAMGFVPNFALGGLGAAINREDRAGVRRDQVRVGHDDRLRGGVGVYNTKEGSLSNAINMHLASGETLKSIQRQGAASGFVPNFKRKADGTWDMRTTAGKAGHAADLKAQSQAERASARSGGGEGMGMGAQMGMMMVGSQLSIMADKMKEANEGVGGFTSGILDLTSQTMMYLPTIQMATQGMGGVTGAFAKANKAILAAATSNAALDISSKKAAVSLGMMSGAGNTGSLLGGVGGGVSSGRRGRRSSGLGGAMNLFGGGYSKSRRGGAGVMSSLTRGGSVAARGGGLAGKALGMAASPLGIAAAVGGAAYLGNKVYSGQRNKEVNRLGKEGGEQAKRAEKAFSGLQKMLEKVAVSTAAYTEALTKGDAAAALSAKKEIIRNIASGGRDMDSLIKEGGGITAGGKKYGSSQEIMEGIRSGDISGSEIGEVMSGVEKVGSKSAELAKATGSVHKILDEFVSNQGAVWSTDLGAGKMEEASDLMVGMMNQMSKEELEVANRAMSGFASDIADLSDDWNISGNEGAKVGKSFHKFLKTMPNQTKAQRTLTQRFSELARTANMDEGALYKLYVTMIKKYQPALLDQTRGLKEMSKPIKSNSKALIDLFNSARGLSTAMSVLEDDLKFAAQVSALMHSGATKMFAIGTKTLSHELGLTASKLTSIEFRNMEDLKKLQMTNARNAQTRFETVQSGMLQAMQSSVGTQLNLAKTNTGKVIGLQAGAFESVVAKGLIPAINKAISSGDIKGAQTAINQAIAKSKQGPDKVESDTAIEKFQEFDKALDKLAISANRKERLDQMQMNQQEKLIAAQRVAALAQLKLAQQIEFAGGVAGASGAPQAAIERVLNNQLGMQRGNAMGDTDMKTKNMIDQIKVLKTLTKPGGLNAANNMVNPLAKQFEANLNKFMTKVGLDPSNFDIKEIAETQAKNVIRPDKNLTDISAQMDKNTYVSDALKVFVANIGEVAGGIDEQTGLPRTTLGYQGEAAYKAATKQKQKAEAAAKDQRSLGLDPVKNKAYLDALRGRKGGLTPAPPRDGYGVNVVDPKMESPYGVGQELLRNSVRYAAGQSGRSRDLRGNFLPGGEDNAKLKAAIQKRDAADKAAQAESKVMAGLSARMGQSTKTRLHHEGNVKKVDKDLFTGDASKLDQEAKTKMATELAKSLPVALKTATERFNKNKKESQDREEQIKEREQRLRNPLTSYGRRGTQQEKNERVFLDAIKKQQAENIKIMQEMKGVAANATKQLGLARDFLETKKQIEQMSEHLKGLQGEKQESMKRGQQKAGEKSKAEDEVNKLRKDAYDTHQNRLAAAAKAVEKFTQGLTRDAEKANTVTNVTNPALQAVDRVLAEILKDKELNSIELENLLKVIADQKKIVSDEVNKTDTRNKNTQDFVKGNLQAGADITPIAAALKQFENTFKNKDIVNSFTTIEAAAASMLNTNKDWATSLEMAQAGLEQIDVEMTDGVIFTGTAAEKMLYMNTAIAKLQSTISIEKWQAGITGVATARDTIIKTLELLRTTGGSTQEIDKQLKLLKQLEDGRIREAKAIEKGLSGQQFLEASTTTLIEFSKKISDLGGKGKVPMDVLRNLEMIREAMAKDLIDVAEAEKLWNEQLVDTGLQLDKVRMMAGLIKPEEYRANLTKGFGELYGTAYEAGEETIRAALLGITEGTEGRKDLNKAGKDELFRKFGGSVYDAIANSSNSARQAQQATMLEYVKSGGSFGEATRKLIDLEEQRRDIYGQLADKAITANQAEVMLAKTRASTSAATLNQQLANGTIAQADYEAGMRALAQTMLEGDVSSEEFGKSLKFTLQALTGLEKNSAQKDFVKMVDRNANAFKQGVKDSFEAAINGTMTFREAMAKVMQDIAADMLKTSISTFVNTAFAAVGNALIPQDKLGKGATGGHVVGGARGIQHFQSGGLVTGGKGGIDDIPARLGRGEYVIKESSARRYGTDYLNDLNAGRVRKFAYGGSVDSSKSGALQNTYDWNDPKKPSSGSFNIDSRLSALGQMDSSNPQNAYKFSRESTLDQYLKDKAADDEMKKNAMLAYRKQRRKIIQGAVIQIATAVATAGINKAVGKKTGKAGSVSADGTAFQDIQQPEGGFAEGTRVIGSGADRQVILPGMSTPLERGQGHVFTGGQERTPQSLANAQMASGAYGGEAATAAQMQQIRAQLVQQNTPQSFGDRMKNWFSTGNWNPFAKDTPSDAPSASGGPGGPSRRASTASFRTAQRMQEATYGKGTSSISAMSSQALQDRHTKQYKKQHRLLHRQDNRLAGGGPAHTRGRDTVPAMLTAGEWVVPKETVDLYGLGFMNKLNKGNVQHFAEGGYVGPRGGGETPSSGGGSASSVNNDFTINVNVTNEGGTSVEGVPGERDQNTQGGLEENERNKELGVRIKGAVVQEIVLQKRPGGLLYNEKRS